MKLYQVRTFWLLLKYCISTHRESTDSLMKDVAHVQKLLHEHSTVYFALELMLTLGVHSWVNINPRNMGEYCMGHCAHLE